MATALLFIIWISFIMSEYYVDHLPNGVRLVTVPMPHLHAVELVCYLAVGGRCERAEQSGISHFLEHMIFRGTEDYADSTALERAFEALGGSVNASTDAETTCFHSRFHPDHVAAGVALFASMLQRPRFADMEIERRIILEEAREDYNEQGEQVNPDNLMVQLLWPEHPLGRPLTGTPETLEAITPATLTGYYRQWYQPGNLVVCACGPVDRSDVVQAVEREFGAWAAQNSPTVAPAPALAHAGPECRWVYDTDSQVSLELAFPLPGRNAEATLAIRMLCRILSWGGGARLNLRLREELGLTYAVEANCSLLADTGYLAIDLSVAPENLVRTVSELLNVLSRLREEVIPVDELSAVVTSYLFDLEFSRDQTDALAVRYGWGLQAGYLRTLEQDIEELNALQASDLLDVARSFLVLEKARLVVVGPWADEQRKKIEELLTLLNWP